MITRVLIRNFKCISDLTIEFRPLTLLMGVNSSGKSSILHAICLYAQSLIEGRISHQGPIINFPNLEDLIKYGESECSIGIEVYRTSYLELTFDRNEHVKSVVLKRDGINGDVLISSEKDFYKHCMSSEYLQKLKDAIPSLTQKGFIIQLDGLYHEISISHDKCKVPEYINVDRKILHEHFLNILNVIENVYYCPVNRYLETDESTLPSEIGHYLEKRVIDDESLIRLLGWSKLSDEYRPILDKFRQYCEEIGLKINVQAIEKRLYPPDSSPHVKIFSQEFGYSLSIRFEYFASGYNQLMKMLMYFAVTDFTSERLNKPAILLIEDPEVNLHPKLQAKLMDLIIQQVVNGKQIIMTTHSEHLLIRLLRRIREGKIGNESVIVHYLVKELDGKITPHRLEIDENGVIKNSEVFLQDFFEEEITDLEVLLRKGA